MSDGRRFIVSTTIRAPSKAIRRFDALADWTLVVAGDRRTPADYHLENGVYLSPQDQERLAPELSRLVGWDSIQRRNLGFVFALDAGAEIVATVDDDNVPYASWGRDLLVGRTVEVPIYEAPNGCFDPVGAAGYPQLWHRGYPLQLLRSRDYGDHSTGSVAVDVQADFWDGDPDVDAVCRLVHAPDVTFDPGGFPFSSAAPAPFNSQNTFLSRRALEHYFVLPGVGRMDDIWAAFHLQSLGYRVVFGPASVHQVRNAHDLTRNLMDEFLGYEKNLSLVQALQRGHYHPKDFWPKRTQRAYEAYRRRVTA